MEEESRKETILLVDDTPSTIELVKTALEEEGYEVFVATSGEKGLKRAALALPDLILLDIRMPGMDGYEACRQLKANTSTAGIPVIFLSGLTHAFDKVKGFALGAVDYVVKPIETEELLARVRTHLTIHHLQHALQEMNRTLEERVQARTAELSKANDALTGEIEERKRIERAVIRAKEEWERTFDAASELIMILDCEYRIVRANTAMAEKVDLTPQTLVGRTCYSVFHGSQEPLPFCPHTQVMADGRKHDAEIHEESLDADFLISVSPLYDADGQLTGSVHIAHDITKHKQAEEELRRHREHLEELVAERTEALEQEVLERKHIEHALQEAKDAAEAANRAKSAFLANMSHELRTPLNAILGFAQLLRRDPQNTQREALNIILRSGEHLLTLINDVLEIARIEVGRIELHPEVCDVSTLIHDVIDMMRNHADAKQLSLTLTPSSDIPRYIQADTSKLRQIFVNLIGNAIKFTETGGVTVRVRSHRLNDLPTPAPSQEGTSSAEARPTSLHVEVADTGIGIVTADQDLIFKPFEQIGMLNTTTGSGLGLTITRQYLELMGGTITVESPSPQAAGTHGGPGSVFRFELPVQPVFVEAITRERAGGGYVVGLEPGQPVYRILIVEDQFEIRVLLRKILEPVGFEVREAVNGTEAIQLFQAWQPQVIFMDRRMLGMDGLEATRRIKALDHGSKSVIIMLTASAFKEQREEAFAAGADDFIRKPFRETELFEILRQHVGVRYVYEEGEGQKAKGEGQKIEEVLTPEALAMLPPDLLDALEQAALQLDLEKMDQVIAAIRPEHHDVAERLAALAQDFHCKEIWTIIQQTRQQERPHE